MLRLSALLLVFLCVGCAAYTDGAAPLPIPAAVQVCPHVYSWSKDQLSRLGDEDVALPPVSMVHRALAEDRDLRAQIKAACGGVYAP